METSYFTNLKKKKQPQESKSHGSGVTCSYLNKIKEQHRVRMHQKFSIVTLLNCGSGMEDRLLSLQLFYKKNYVHMLVFQLKNTPSISSILRLILNIRMDPKFPCGQSQEGDPQGMRLTLKLQKPASGCS